jgi:hypothetical protein
VFIRPLHSIFQRRGTRHGKSNADLTALTFQCAFTYSNSTFLGWNLS